MELCGLCIVTFLNNAVKTVDVYGLTHDIDGIPLYLKSTNGSIYNWDNIIAIEKTSNE